MRRHGPSCRGRTVRRAFGSKVCNLRHTAVHSGEALNYVCIYGVMNLSSYSRPPPYAALTTFRTLCRLCSSYFASRLSLSRPDAPVRPPRLVGLYSLQLVLPRLFPRAGLGSARGAPCECDSRSILPREARAREPPMSRPNTLGAHACHMSSTFNRGPFGGVSHLLRAYPHAAD